MAKPALRRPGSSLPLPLSRLALLRQHPLAAGLRFCIVCQGGAAIDLVTGERATVSGTLAEGTTSDGRAADIDGSDYFEFLDTDLRDITGDITIVWRGVLDDTGDAALCCKATSDAGYNSPFYFCINSSGQVDFIRTNASQFSFWRGSSIAAGAATTVGVTNPATSNASCLTYVDGVPTSASLLFSAGATTVTANSQPLRIGRDIAGTPKQLNGRTSIVMGWARQLAAAEMMRVHRDPYLLIGDKRDRRVLGVIAGGLIQPAGLATETDTAFGIGWSKSRAVGLASETATALAATPRRAAAIGIVSEIDTAPAMSWSRALAAGLAAESDSALAATPLRARAVGQPAESDSALAAGRAKAAAAGQAAESDTALALTIGSGVAVGQAEEADSALAATARRTRAVGLAAESDAAFAATALRLRLVGLATEADSPQAIVVVRRKAVGLAEETDTALALSWRRALTIAAALETDTALALVIAADGTAIPRSGGAVTMGGGSDGVAAVRAASAAAIARALGTPAVPR